MLDKDQIQYFLPCLCCFLCALLKFCVHVSRWDNVCISISMLLGSKEHTRRMNRCVTWLGPLTKGTRERNSWTRHTKGLFHYDLRQFNICIKEVLNKSRRNTIIILSTILLCKICPPWLPWSNVREDPKAKNNAWFKSIIRTIIQQLTAEQGLDSRCDKIKMKKKSLCY